ncbi:MAG TPA: hypothetical protein VFE62_24165 [Gemmataceae bacterium]|nr:hypothetical protein [Gemmataceae bacterium]
MSFISDIWHRLTSAIEGEATTVANTLTDLEQKLLPGFGALVKQIEATIGQQGLTILEQALTDIATVIATGGNPGATIAALVPQVTAQVKADLKQDATNAAHGAISLLIATLPAPNATAPASTPPVA